MAYTLSNFYLNNGANASAAITNLSVDVTPKVNFNEDYKKLYPVILYIHDDFISNYTNASYYISQSASAYTRTLYHYKTANGARRWVIEPGLYLFYNPTDNSNNAGFVVDENNTTSEVDFETLQKYAPWPIVAPSV